MAKNKKLPTEVLDRLAKTKQTEKLHERLKSSLNKGSNDGSVIHSLNVFFNRELTAVGGKASIARIHLLVSAGEDAWLKSFDKFVLPTLV